MMIQKLSRGLRSLLFKRIINMEPQKKEPSQAQSQHVYTPTPYLNFHAFQSIYDLFSSNIKLPFQREKVYFTDGGHVSLDWLNKTKYEDSNRPITFIMHGMTGGSQTKYIRAIARKADQEGYICVCLNSRGINSEMTSPIPFIGLGFHEIQQALNRVKCHFPKSPIHLIGTSLGGNYLLRYLIKHKPYATTEANQIKSLSLISSPFNVKYVVDNMNSMYQRFFIRSYIQHTVLKHPQMEFWWKNEIVDLKHLKQSSSLRQFHDRITSKVLGEPDMDIVFDKYTIHQKDIEELGLETFVLTAQDDPMVHYKTTPLEAIKRNPKIQFVSTKTGGHLCWFQGLMSPQRWYPKPVFEFINSVRDRPQTMDKRIR